MFFEVNPPLGPPEKLRCAVRWFPLMPFCAFRAGNSRRCSIRRRTCAQLVGRMLEPGTLAGLGW